MHVTAGALLDRGTEILLVERRAYGIVLQPGGHLAPADVMLAGAAERELTEETGIDPSMVSRVSQTPCTSSTAGSRPGRRRDEPDHFHLDFRYL
jgi:8-oxo-dGTP pyrophosphatase MutT (NUDIX family)